GYANRCVWPALHYRLDLACCSEIDAEAYFSVNARFADALMPLLDPGDTIWVHDYHLIPLGEELRLRGCTARIGFFLHTPFPSPEVFAAVPHGRILRVSSPPAWTASGLGATFSPRTVRRRRPRSSPSALPPRNLPSSPRPKASKDRFCLSRTMR